MSENTPRNLRSKNRGSGDFHRIWFSFWCHLVLQCTREQFQAFYKHLLLIQLEGASVGLPYSPPCETLPSYSIRTAQGGSCSASNLSAVLLLENSHNASEKRLSPGSRERCKHYTHKASGIWENWNLALSRTASIS